MTLEDLDPFDLPEWIATSEVTWRPRRSAADPGHLLTGELVGAGEANHPCDVLAVDEAYPQPVADADLRTRVHRAWHHGQVLTLDVDGRLTLAVPGTRPGVDEVLEALGRLALAVGASLDHISALLSLGQTERGRTERGRTAR